MTGDDQLTVAYQTEQTDIDSSATIVMTGPNGTTVEESLNISTVRTVQESLNLSALDEGTATVSIRAEGVNFRAQVAPRVGSFDIDSDGIPNAIETRNWTSPRGGSRDVHH